MTYSATETSYQSGAPVELYDFARGSLHWRYTSSDQAVTFNTSTYDSALIKRGAIEATQELARSPVTLSTPRDFAVADMFRIAPPTDVITLTITRYHAGDGEGVVVWMGRVLNVEWAGGEATIHCEPVVTSLNRNGLRRLYQRQCPHVLYSPACGVDATARRVVAAVDSVVGIVLQISELSAQADGYYSGGFVEWETVSGIFERRFITQHIGVSITLNQPFDGITIGTTVRVYPGCDHTTSTCNGKFANLPNYGGFPYIPIKNPFGGNGVF